LAAQVAEVRDPQLEEGRHREVLRARVLQVRHDLAPAAAHPAQMPPREAGQPDPPGEAHLDFAPLFPVVKSMTLSIARRQTAQKGTSSRVNMMQSACGL